MIWGSGFNDPSNLRLREDSGTVRGSNGCVECPSDIGQCPTCPDNRYCTMTTQTCDTCSKYVCIEKSNATNSSGTNIGGIVGGVVGGVAVLALALGLYYMLIYRKKQPRLSEDSDWHDSKYQMDSQYGVGGRDSNLGGWGGAEGSVRGEKHDKLGPDSTRYLPSSYESFMRPPRYKKNGGSNQRRGLNSSILSPFSSNTPFEASETSNRHSVATTVSTTNASNILPIAYIPGVTIRPTKNNTRSIFSYDTESVFSDMNAIDNASVLQKRTDLVAVKAQARLVSVPKIEEENEEENGKEGESNLELGHASQVQIHIQADSDSDIDSDVDSDIGEIKRATSTRRNPAGRDSLEDHEDYAENANGHVFTLEHKESSEDYDSEVETQEHNFPGTDIGKNVESFIEEDEYDDGSKSFVLEIARET